MVFNMITLKSTTATNIKYIITLCLLIILVQFTIGWNNKRYILWIMTLPMLSLSALLGLNTVVLYIYLKYFVSPHARRKVDSFKPLRFTHKSIWPRLEQLRQLDNTPSETAFTSLTDGNDPEIEAAFNQLLQYVIRDFISSWFIKITGTLSEQSFPIAVDHIIRSAASNITTRLEKTDLLFITINKIIPKMTLHISEFRTAETSLRGKSLERSVTQSDELDLLLASRFRHGKLHPALTTAAVTTKPTEIAYLRHLIERVLPLIIEKKELASGPVRVVIREIVSNSVMQPVLDMLADPDFWNQTIDTYLGKAIIEQKMVRQLREVLNRHSTNEIDPEEVMNVFKSNDLTPKTTSKSATKRPKIKMGPKTQLSSAYLGTGVLTSTTEDDDGYSDDDERGEEDEVDENVRDRPSNTKSKDAEDDFFFFQQPLSQQRRKRFGVGYSNSVKMGKRTYQDFLKLINEEKNLLDLKRVRNDIVTQIRKKKAQIAERDPEEVMDGEKVEDIIVYVNRLSSAKKRVDKRIATLSGEQFNFRKSTSQLFGVGYGNSSRKQSSASHIGIGYNLQDILTNTSGLSYFMEFMDRRGDMVKLQFWLIVEGFHSTDITTPHEQKTFLQDVKMVYDMYFTDFAPHRLHLASEQLNTDLKTSIKQAEENSLLDEVKFADSIRELRLRLYRIQQHVFWEIEKEHYPYFKRSDLYFKFLASAPPITDTKTTAVTTAIPENDVVPAPARRSLDESTLYNHSASRRPSIHTPRPASIHESILNTVAIPSSSMATAVEKNKMDKKAESDSELSSNTTQQHHPIKLKPSVSDYGRLRGHQRALSDSTKTAPSSSRFLSFSNMFAWNNHERRPGSSSVPTSIKSLELTTEDETSMDKSSILEDEEEEQVQKNNRLVKSNTVDAVEAELRSILDGKNSDNNENDVTVATEEDEKTTTTPTIEAPKPQSTKSLPSLLLKTSSSSALLLCGNKGIKSSTAAPIQNVHALPSWTSSGGTSTISEIEHDSLESLVSTPPAIKSTPSPKPSSVTPAIPEDEVLDTSPITPSAATENNTKADNIHFAPPGDLMLAAKVAQLTEEIEKLSAQEAIVDALIAKAESQNKLEELRILKKSKSMFRQELQQIQYQKSQYELQESENVLHPERSKVNITSATIGSDKHGEFALYVIEIQQLGFDGNYASGWIVARRYSEFFALHTKLKETYSIVKLIEFPAKWPLLKLQKPFVEARRISLERYLRRLMEEKEICSSQELRSFLSQQNIFVPGPTNSNEGGEWMGGLFGTATNPAATSVPLQPSSSSSSLHSLTSPSIQNLQKSMAASSSGASGVNNGEQPKGFMRHIYKTVAAGIDDILIGPSMLDLITQRLGEQVTEFSTTTSPPASSTSSSSQRLTDSISTAAAGVPDSTITPATVENIPDSLKAEGITRFTEPLCDLFIEMFELKDKTNWLRRQAIVIILQQILEGTIERKLRESMRWLSSSSMVVFYFNKITNSLWPDGGPLTFKEARKPEEKNTSREEANRKLSTWLPDLLSNMVGRQNARKGARRLFTVLQNKRLNQDLVYNLLDEIVYALFPELLESPNNAFVK